MEGSKAVPLREIALKALIRNAPQSIKMLI
jgi:hypothetical protein